jgi:predicted RNA-binding protein with PIN domain
MALFADAGELNRDRPVAMLEVPKGVSRTSDSDGQSGICGQGSRRLSSRMADWSKGSS